MLLLTGRRPLLSILVTVLFSYVVFHEKLSRRSALGLVLLGGNAGDAGVTPRQAAEKTACFFAKVPVKSS